MQSPRYGKWVERRRGQARTERFGASDCRHVVVFMQAFPKADDGPSAGAAAQPASTDRRMCSERPPHVGQRANQPHKLIGL